MSQSAHARYRRELELLASDEPLLDALGLDAGWRRVSARFHPDADPYASLTLEKWGRRLRVDVRPGPRFVATPAEDDLPALKPLLEAGAEIVRYHPGLRATVRLGERFAKVAGDATTLCAHQREIWMHRAEILFAVAEPLAADDHTLWLSTVPGEPAGPEHAERAGAALATLHRARLTAPPWVDRAPRAAQELARIVPALRREAEALLVPIERTTPRPLHGAPHPPQWLADGDRLGLIDFDRLSRGDPEADVAAYMEAAAAEDGGDAVAEAFARGYGPGLDLQRLAAHRARRRILKALRAATALRPDGDERAAHRLNGRGRP